MMILFDNEEEARILQRNFEQLILMVEKSLSIIWPPEDTTGYQAHASQVWHNIYTVFKPGFHIVVSVVRKKFIGQIQLVVQDRMNSICPMNFFRMMETLLE